MESRSGIAAVGLSFSSFVMAGLFEKAPLPRLKSP